MKPMYSNVHETLQKLKSELTAPVVVLLIICTTITFWLGRQTLRTPNEKYICRVQISKLESKTQELKGLRDRAATLARQTQELQDSCDKRLRILPKRQQDMCNVRITNRVSTERESFMMFKCANCKRLGKCK